MHPKVSIIILNWNGLEDTIECLESLKKMTYSNYQTIVVDNGSEGNDVRVLKEKFGDYIHLIENDRNYGFAEGNNIGTRYALAHYNPDYILLLNNDTVVDPDFLNELVKVAENDAGIGILGPKLLFHHEPTRIQSVGGKIRWWTGETLLIGRNEVDNGQFNEIKEVDWIVGCALLARRTMIEAIGLIYPTYFSFFEESDWCVRCKKAGFTIVYVPNARVWHKGGQAAGRVFGFRMYYMTRGRFLFMKRNLGRLQLLSSLIYFFLWEFTFTTVFLLIRQKNPKLLRTFYKGVYDGIGLTLRT